MKHSHTVFHAVTLVCSGRKQECPRKEIQDLAQYTVALTMTSPVDSLGTSKGGAEC